MEILASVVGTYGVYGLIFFFFLAIFVTHLGKMKILSVVERLFYSDSYLIDNSIYFIGSPTCIRHALQVGSCLSQGEGSNKHREEHLQGREREALWLIMISESLVPGC